MKSLQFTLVFLCLFGTAYAQKNNLEGRVVDSLNQPLAGATVMLLEAKDSVLAKFGISNEKGIFSLEEVVPDDYILQITFLGYSNLSETLNKESIQNNNNLGDFLLLPESALLDMVEVKAEHIPIQFRKDTVEYNAAAFKTRPNAAVEDLLKKMPGIEVERDGSIKAHGETVQKVLVDGKEFFGNDSKVATKNLPADAIDKVQVFDKKSDVAAFSGIDDGREAKTINLSLKEDKKQGYFGRLEGAYGTDDRYEGKFNINRFGQNIQFSGVGMFNNTNQIGFSVNDYINMMGGLNNFLSGGSGRIELNLDADEIGIPLDAGQQNQGFTTTNAAGFNLNWNINNKTKLHSSYFYNKVKKEADRFQDRQNIIGDQSFKSTRADENIRENEGHRLNITLDSKIDSFQTIKWRSSFGANTTSVANKSFSETFNFSDIIENNSQRNYESNNNNWQLNSNLVYLRRFHKKGRFFTANLAYEHRQKDKTAQLNAFNQFFSDIGMTDSLRQEQLQDDQQHNYGLKLSYTEPLGKRKYIEGNYSFQNYSNNLVKDVFDKKEQQLVRNNQLSNHFERDYLYNRFGFNFKWNGKKLRLNTGLNAQHSSLKGKLVIQDVAIDQNFFNLLPRLSMDYDIKNSKNLRFVYETSVQEPSLEQLQPIIDNNDPLNVYVGNPDLIPEYFHDFRLNFFSFDRFSSINIFANLNASITENKIINSKQLGADFSQSIQPVNFKDESSLGSYISFGAPLKMIKSRINLTTDYRFRRGNYLVNDIGNQFNSNTYGLDISISNQNTDIIDLRLGYKTTFNKINYSLEDFADQSYTNQIFYGDLAINIGSNLTISSSMDYSRYTGVAFEGTTNLPILTAAISWHLLKNKRGTLKLSANDLLNKNVGINRISQLNYIQEERISSLARYFLLGFSYSLSGFGRQEANYIRMEKRR
jgi:outer membrane receptor protein involved in Fe transport